MKIIEIIGADYEKINFTLFIDADTIFSLIAVQSEHRRFP